MKEKGKGKWLILLGVIAFAAILLMACVTGAHYEERKEKKEDFIIIPSTQFDMECANAALEILKKEGFSGVCADVDEADMEKLCQRYEAVICIGRKACESFLSSDKKTLCICCITDSLPYESPREGVVLISPGLSAKSMAEAACTLFSKEESIALVSEKKGGEDLQAACDLLDSLGVDYRAEILLGRSYTEVARDALSKGYGAVIIPAVLSGDDGDLSDILTIAMGDGKEMCSALSFSLNGKALAGEIAAAYKRIRAGAQGEEPLWNEGLYSLHIKEWAREKMSDSGVGIVAETYEIIIVP